MPFILKQRAHPSLSHPTSHPPNTILAITASCPKKETKMTLLLSAPEAPAVENNLYNSAKVREEKKDGTISFGSLTLNPKRKTTRDSRRK